MSTNDENPPCENCGEPHSYKYYVLFRGVPYWMCTHKCSTEWKEQKERETIHASTRAGGVVPRKVSGH